MDRYKDGQRDDKANYSKMLITESSWSAHRY